MESSDDEQLVMENMVSKFLMIAEDLCREEWVNEYFQDREDKEHKHFFPDLLKQPDKLF